MPVIRFTPTRAASRAAGARRAAVRAVLVALSAGLAVAVPAAVPAGAAPPSDYRVRGVDTSHHNHPGGQAVDWTEVRDAGFSFMVAKATEGATVRDEWFARDVARAKSAGLIRGAYDFYATARGAQQAENFVRTMKGAGYTGKAAGELPPAVDLELRKDQCPAGFSAGQLGDFLRAVQSASGVRPIVYTSRYFVDRCMGGDGSLLNGYMLWQPRHRSGSREPAAVPGAGSGWKIWQHSEEATVPGIPSKNHTDLDVFRGALAELRRIAHHPAG